MFISVQILIGIILISIGSGGFLYAMICHCIDCVKWMQQVKKMDEDFYKEIEEKMKKAYEKKD